MRTELERDMENKNKIKAKDISAARKQHEEVLQYEKQLRSLLARLDEVLRMKEPNMTPEEIQKTRTRAARSMRNLGEERKALEQKFEELKHETTLQKGKPKPENKEKIDEINDKQRNGNEINPNENISVNVDLPKKSKNFVKDSTQKTKIQHGNNTQEIGNICFVQEFPEISSALSLTKEVTSSSVVASNKLSVPLITFSPNDYVPAASMIKNVSLLEVAAYKPPLKSTEIRQHLPSSCKGIDRVYSCGNRKRVKVTNYGNDFKHVLHLLNEHGFPLVNVNHSLPATRSLNVVCYKTGNKTCYWRNDCKFANENLKTSDRSALMVAFASQDILAAFKQPFPRTLPCETLLPRRMKEKLLSGEMESTSELPHKPISTPLPLREISTSAPMVEFASQQIPSAVEQPSPQQISSHSLPPNENTVVSVYRNVSKHKIKSAPEHKLIPPTSLAQGDISTSAKKHEKQTITSEDSMIKMKKEKRSVWSRLFSLFSCCFRKPRH